VPFPGLATIVAATLAVMILLRCARWLPQAQPSDRSLHVKPLSRVGGLAIATGVAAGVPGWGPLAGVAAGSAWIIAAASLAVAAISLIDDWRGTGAPVRLAVHGCAALAVASTLPLDRPSAAAAAVAIVWMANLFNFMDGNDGLAAVAAICGFAAYAASASATGANAVPYACIALAVLPFLAINAPPARMFMGDGAPSRFGSPRRRWESPVSPLAHGPRGCRHWRSSR
jgi:UDP-N-acetylmuramyl pentapeptide phosphotransferase/UDP-N-acetylglucosamine-1-phosphate transferase